MSGSVIIRGYDEVKGAVDLTCDRVHNSIVSIGAVHRETHEGRHFFVNKSATIDNGESLSIRFKTGDEKDIHAIFNAYASAGSTLQLFEDSTVTHVAANALTKQNFNRRLISQSVMGDICHTPSGNEIRSAFRQYRVGSDKSASGSGDRGETEFVLRHNTVYHMKITADSNGTEVVLDVDWYEAETIDAVGAQLIDIPVS